MATILLTFSCGHKEDRQLFGMVAERERLISAALEQPCIDCNYKFAMARDVAAGIAPLTGSEKDVAWASNSRARMTALLDEKVQRFQESGAGETKMIELLTKAARVKSNTATKFWIKHQFSSAKEMIRLAGL